MRASIVWGLLGLLLLVVSFAPWPGNAESASRSASNTAVSQKELVDEGRALFLAKGCATCHRHGAVGRQPGLVEVGPTLTGYEPDEAFMRRWLRDPQAIRPTTNMPNLALAEREIEALIAFLAAP
jgi:cytochrome c2